MVIANMSRTLLAISACCLLLVFANPGIASEQNGDLSQIIEKLKFLSDKQGREPEEQSSFMDIKKKVRDLELNDNSLEREKLTDILIYMLLNGKGYNKTFALMIIGDLPYNSPKLVQALHEDLLDIPKCNGIDCLIMGTSFLEIICVTLHKKDPANIGPRCEKEIGWQLPLR